MLRYLINESLTLEKTKRKIIKKLTCFISEKVVKVNLFSHIVRVIFLSLSYNEKLTNKYNKLTKQCKNA